MTRGTMLILLERQLNDVTNQDWDQSALDEALDHGIFEAAKLQYAILPDSLKARAKADIEKDVDLYIKPPDSWMLYKVRLWNTAEGKYKTLRKADYDVALERGEGGETTWSHFGRYVAILPTPTENIVNGLQFLYVPGAGSTAPPGQPPDRLAEIPSIHVGLHRYAVLQAAIVLLSETGEAIKELRITVEAEEKKAPTWLRADVAENEVFVPQLDKGY